VSAAPGIRVVAAGGAETPVASDAAPGSVRAALQHAAAEQARERTIDLSIGGAFGPHLLARYRVLNVDELERFPQLAAKVADIYVAVEMMVTTCTTLLWRDDHGDVNDLNVTYSPKLWELMGWPLPEHVELDDLTPREVVVKLFGGNGSALAMHLQRLSEWLQHPESAMPGESSAAT
jgi:hypothetical protein